MAKLLVIEEMLYISNNFLQSARKIIGQELGGGFLDLGAGI